jgi:hypothetical protein
MSVQNKVKEGNGFSFDPSGTGYLYSVSSDFPTDITLLESRNSVVENGQEIDRKNGLYNHHNVFIDMSRSSPPFLGCGDGTAFSSIPVSIISGGAADQTFNRYTSTDGSFKSGMYISKGAPIIQMIDIVNYSNDTKTVYTVTEMEFLPGKQPDFLKSGTAGIDFGMCSGKSGMFVYAPKGQSKFTFTGKDLTVEKAGYLLNVRGHMHDGGQDMVVKINGEEVCTSKAEYGGAGHEGVGADGKAYTSIRGMTTCDTPIKLKKGDKLSVAANFDMEQHPA